MFYTSIITSVLPYILLLGIFSTLLLNRFACTSNSANTKRGYAAIQKQQDIDASSTYLFSLEQEKDQKKQPDKIKVYSSSGITKEFLNEANKIYRPPDFVLISIPGLNNTFCLRGPPA
jgi:hypothetical protein